MLWVCHLMLARIASGVVTISIHVLAEWFAIATGVASDNTGVWGIRRCVGGLYLVWRPSALMRLWIESCWSYAPMWLHMRPVDSF